MKRELTAAAVSTLCAFATLLSAVPAESAPMLPDGESRIHAIWLTAAGICLSKRDGIDERAMDIAIKQRLINIGANPAQRESDSVKLIAPKFASMLPASCDPNDMQNPTEAIGELMRQETATLERQEKSNREMVNYWKCVADLTRAKVSTDACRIYWSLLR